MVIKYRDFAPPSEELGLLGKPASSASFAQAVEAANTWMEAFQIDVVNIETVLLPNVAGEDGTGEGELRETDDVGTYWYQIVRVWYRDPGPVHDTEEIRVFNPDGSSS